MRSKSNLFAGLFFTLILAGAANAATPTLPDLDSEFHKTVQPFVTTYCIECHGGDKPESGFNLEKFTSLDLVAKDDKHWAAVILRLKNGEMPPVDADAHPKPEERAAIINWITQFRTFQARKYAGDPGVVLARRLSNAEYNNTIRDLTGQDMQPTKEFPIDPANQAGFDTSGESLTMSPGLLKKYMDAAQFVGEHLVLKPDGIAFAPYPVMADTDRDKYCVNQIMDFYRKQPTDLALYFWATLEYEDRAALGQPQASVDDIAAATKVSPKYLHMVVSALEAPEKLGPIAGLEALLKNLPVPDAKGADAAWKGCKSMRDLVIGLRAWVRPEFDNLTAPTMHVGSQPLVTWKDRQYASTRLEYAPGSALLVTADFLAPGTVAAPLMAIPKSADDRKAYEDAYKRFCAVFPDLMLVTERGLMYADPATSAEAKLPGRYISAGFHSQSGYFRDDAPLYQLILNPQQQKELDARWDDLTFFALPVAKQYAGMMWFERTDSSFMRTTDFDFVRSEDKDSTSEAKVLKLKDAWLAKATRNGASKTALDAITYHFDDVNKSMRWLEKAQVDAEPIHVQKLVEFAERAYRRPLEQTEKDDIVAFYHSLRTEDQLDHETAVRETLVSILVSPYFCYRANVAPVANQVAALSDYELANKLSYFFWSSMPDDELLAHAAAGDLHQPDVLLAQARRMVQDDRVRGLATEFGGNWLDFRQFEETNSVDRQRFPDFTNDLREAMFQEPIRFFMDIAQRDSSVMDFLFGNYTFVNPVLARHYGMPVSSTSADQWVRVDNADQYSRGGLLPMAVFQTKNAPGLRTSPVKRGYWVVRRLLGEEIPPPPPNVPALPPDESKLNGLTLPQLLATHRQNASCAACHVHFDSIGLAFEGFGPTGQIRTLDMGGKPVENHVTFRDGSEGTGLDGLKSYLMTRRKGDFVENLCRKLLAKALDRTLILSDDPLIDDMAAKLEANDFRFSVLVDTIITSPQFLNKKG